MNLDYVMRQVSLVKENFPGCTPIEIARGLGINVSLKYLGSLKGLYISFEDEAFIIINSSLNDAERHIAIAHEIGHDRLHKDACKSASFADSMLFDAKGKAEFEANLFAAELMIDDKSVLDSNEDCYSLARRLFVHPQLMLFKLYSMNHRGFKIPMPEDFRSDFLGR
ncbi:MAG: ImmA/IrrE family metallo-endopeptidase [Christensenellaceae bacterium]|nr:ImmA/IrrE family metallo-endopeptidase [Christensenellaceae bacterium]